MVKFSVIVPIYNVEKYLSKCIESLINQTYDNIEIILINDGSTDNCSSIIERFASIDERIIPISKQNGGLSEARNTGLSIASGDYIAFVDGDDWVESNMFEVLNSHLESMNEKPDFTCFRLQFDNETLNTHVIYGHEFLINNIQGWENIITDTVLVKNITTSAWSKVYKKSFLDKWDFTFEPNIVNEDTLFSIIIASQANLVSFVNNVLYHAIERDGSISRSSQERLFIDMDYALEKAKSILINYNKFHIIKSIYEARYLKSMLYNLLQSAQRLSLHEYIKIVNILHSKTYFDLYNKKKNRIILPFLHKTLLVISKYPIFFYYTIRFFNLLSFKMH